MACMPCTYRGSTRFHQNISSIIIPAHINIIHFLSKWPWSICLLVCPRVYIFLTPPPPMNRDFHFDTKDRIKCQVPLPINHNTHTYFSNNRPNHEVALDIPSSNHFVGIYIIRQISVEPLDGLCSSDICSQGANVEIGG